MKMSMKIFSPILCEIVMV